ncbi:hypothetical protein OSCI_3800048 [Kamptonema sp. PCC 6506]|nr:hypothetical protein OSCI_3800048 [Kamptonema sp. PCC 6506]
MAKFRFFNKRDNFARVNNQQLRFTIATALLLGFQHSHVFLDSGLALLFYLSERCHYSLCLVNFGCYWHLDRRHLAYNTA